MSFGVGIGGPGCAKISIDKNTRGEKEMIRKRKSNPKLAYAESEKRRQNYKKEENEELLPPARKGKKGSAWTLARAATGSGTKGTSKPSGVT